ncbi:hypothetical protein EDC04DRAFT_2605818 [Pisolithus marmoratus]|nr:hypothetical protein EDC04DRAFT_2605818 [Pisolithus marmoratus]
MADQSHWLVIGGSLKQMLATLPLEPGPSDILTVFHDSETVRNFFPNSTCDFYAVVIGTPAGIHCTRHGWSRELERHTQSFWEALAFMTVKGQDTHMPPLLTSTELTHDLHSQVCHLTGAMTTQSLLIIVPLKLIKPANMLFPAITTSPNLPQKLEHKLDDWGSLVLEPFALQLAALGMALAEATYLGDLLYL